MGMIDDVLDFYYHLDLSSVPQDVLHQVSRTLLDYLGEACYASAHPPCIALVSAILDGAGPGETLVLGEKDKRSMDTAAFINACRISNLELDDVSGMGASVHPGVYVWSAVLAALQQTVCPTQTLYRAVLLGYELTLRMGLLSTEKVRELGLHGPGMNGAFGALASAGMILGLSKQELRNAIGIAGALLPLCPFVSFTEGADVKDLYGGWGVHLAFMAIRAAKAGATGPEGILDGAKSLKSVYAGEKGREEPGRDYMIRWISFKEFSSCASVHPAASALLALMDEEKFSAKDVDSMRISTYPYSYALNESVGKLNVSSARLSLPFTMATVLKTRGLWPDGFTKEALTDPDTLALAGRIQVEEHEEYGTGPFGIRGAIVEVVLKDGRHLKRESIGSRWSGAVTDEQLKGKFFHLSADWLSREAQEHLSETVMALQPDASLEPLMHDVIKALSRSEA